MTYLDTAVEQQEEARSVCMRRCLGCEPLRELLVPGPHVVIDVQENTVRSVAHAQWRVCALILR